MAEEQNTAGCSEESCASAGTCTSKKVDMHEPMNMYSSIKKVIGVVSGKGGVGKVPCDSIPCKNDESKRIQCWYHGCRYYRSIDSEDVWSS